MKLSILFNLFDLILIPVRLPQCPHLHVAPGPGLPSLPEHRALVPGVVAGDGVVIGRALSPAVIMLLNKEGGKKSSIMVSSVSSLNS